VGIVRACIRAGAKGRFFNVVDLVNKLDAEARGGKQGRTADLLGRLDFLVLDELGYRRRPRPSAPSCTRAACHGSRPASPFRPECASRAGGPSSYAVRRR
jgi:hypothetical protein